MGSSRGKSRGSLCQLLMLGTEKKGASTSSKSVNLSHQGRGTEQEETCRKQWNPVCWLFLVCQTLHSKVIVRLCDEIWKTKWAKMKVSKPQTQWAPKNSLLHLPCICGTRPETGDICELLITPGQKLDPSWSRWPQAEMCVCIYGKCPLRC